MVNKVHLSMLLRKQSKLMDNQNIDVRLRGKILYDQLYANPNIKRTLRIMDKYGTHYTYTLNGIKY